MYLLEWMLWHTQTSQLENKDWQEKLKRHISKHHKEKHTHEKSLPGIHDSVSEHPCANGSIYSFNETYIDLLAGSSQSRRGIITYFTIAITYLLLGFASTTTLMNTAWFTEVYYWGKDPATASDYITGLF